MKKNEITLLFLIAVTSVVVAGILGSALFGDPGKASERVPVVERLPEGIVQPDPLVFNSQAIDPTQTVCIGDSGVSDDPNCSNQFTPPADPGEEGTDPTTPDPNNPGTDQGAL